VDEHLIIIVILYVFITFFISILITIHSRYSGLAKHFAKSNDDNFIPNSVNVFLKCLFSDEFFPTIFYVILQALVLFIVIQFFIAVILLIIGFVFYFAIK